MGELGARARARFPGSSQAQPPPDQIDGAEGGAAPEAYFWSNKDAPWYMWSALTAHSVDDHSCKAENGGYCGLERSSAASWVQGEAPATVPAAERS